VKRTFVVACVLASLLLGPGAPAATRRPPPVVKLTISNFRFCKATSCNPQDVGYVRTDSGPVPGTDNLVINVKRGSLVKWYYRDGLCDSVDGCPGHNVVFEKSGPDRRVGTVPSHHGARTISELIMHRRGTTIRYYCSVNGHYMFGMTGIIKVT
jgi:hypothetical protein